MKPLMPGLLAHWLNKDQVSTWIGERLDSGVGGMGLDTDVA